MGIWLMKYFFIEYKVLEIIVVLIYCFFSVKSYKKVEKKIYFFLVLGKNRLSSIGNFFCSLGV